MGHFLVSILVDLMTGESSRRLRAAEAFETPPMGPSARRYRAVALGLLMAASTLLLAAALVDTVAGDRPLGEWCGWSGIACLQGCVFCGLRYAAVNRKPGVDDDGRRVGRG